MTLYFAEELRQHGIAAENTVLIKCRASNRSSPSGTAGMVSSGFDMGCTNHLTYVSFIGNPLSHPRQETAMEHARETGDGA